DLAKVAQIETGEAFDGAGGVDVFVDIALDERADRAEGRLAAVQAGIARAGDRAPAARLAVEKQDVVEIIRRFDAEDERRIAVLLKYACGEQRCLSAMSAAVAHDLAKAAQCLAAALGVVRQAVEKMLDGLGCAQALDQPALGFGEGGKWRRCGC